MNTVLEIIAAIGMVIIFFIAVLIAWLLLEIALDERRERKIKNGHRKTKKNDN